MEYRYSLIGLNADEASSAYEAYSLLHYGIDRHGNSFPVHLVAWGSGQNVLYTYLLMPFIKIMGLTVLSTRLPMALIGCISLLVMYKLLKENTNKKTTLIGTTFLAICPWHIMKSRWGLESNLFPDLVLIAVFVLIYGIKNKKMWMFYVSSAIMGVSAYTYGTSYFFLPVFIMLMLLYMIHMKDIKIRQAVMSLGIIFITTIPLILFIIINTFDLPQINLGVLTIPRLTANRYQELTSVFSSDFIRTSIKNFIASMEILILQTDQLEWNAIPFYGTIYIFSLPFTIIGIMKCLKDKKKILLNSIMNIWFVAAILLTFICEPNINRINIIMFPIIYYTVMGLYEISMHNKKSFIVIMMIYSLAFIGFMKQYISKDFGECYVFEDNLEEVFEYVETTEAKNIYFTNKIKEPYIYALFYTKEDTDEFVETVKYSIQGTDFDVVKSFGRYNFYIPDEINENSIYVIEKTDLVNYDPTKWKIIEFKRFIIVEKI